MDFEEEGFGFFGGEEGVATGDEGYTGCSTNVTVTLEVVTDREPTIFDGEEIDYLGRGNLGPLESVSVEVDWERSFIGLVAQAFYCMPLGTGIGVGFLASVAIEEATGGSARGRDSRASFFLPFWGGGNGFRINVGPLL